jgi:phenylalanine-4-hydroxylase
MRFSNRKDTDAAIASGPSQASVIESLPRHLRPFVQVQDYAQQYTPRDQALWRFLMTALTRSLRDSAHSVYLEGLARTGIALDHVPSIDAMNSCLAKIGWRAVVVDGFIPPAIFMEFQALKVLVIALDMRSVEHLFYTPAPDILHESAGHAPFIVDVDYAEFLQRFGEIGMQAIASRQDMDIFSAIRNLSVLKERGDSSAEDIAAAEARLEELAAQDSAPSEAALLTRLHWWTVEYGLVGELQDYRIFGAGLLSSLGESQSCLDDDRVRKFPLTVNAVTTPYDITAAQPQLFVTRSCKHLSQVLEEFAAAMAFRRGGADSLRRAIDAEVVCTAEYDSGVQVSGIFDEVLCDAVGKAIYLRSVGPTQLAWRGRQLYGHGVEAHREGFGAPIGLLKDFSRCLSDYTFDELKAHGIIMGERVRLEFLSGITVEGLLDDCLRQEHRNLLLSFSACTVTTLEGRTLFLPAWGRYDMSVGGAISSVFGGVADRESYRLYEPLPRSSTPASSADPELMRHYAQVASFGAGKRVPDTPRLQELAEMLDRYPQEWLLHVEILRIATDVALPHALLERVRSELSALVSDGQHRRALALVFPDDFPTA